MNIEQQLKNQIIFQDAHLQIALPTIRAAEALEKHLQSAGINAHANGQLDTDGCSVVLYITGSYEAALNALDRIGITPTLITEHDTVLIKIRSYTALVHGQQIDIVICPEMHAPAAEYVGEIHPIEYKEAA